MTDKRCLLHKGHLEEFKAWLRDVAGLDFRDGKGEWQALQVYTAGGWQVVFHRAEMKQHFSLNEKLVPTVRAFYAYRKEAKYDTVRNVPTSEVPWD